MVRRVELKNEFVDVNGYLYICDETKHAYLIDPGAQPKKLCRIINTLALKVDKILITHGHYDHIFAADVMRKTLHAGIYIHNNGKRFLSDPHYNLSEMLYIDDISISADGFFSDKDVLTLDNGGLPLAVIHTPGHTDDSCVFYSDKDKLAFTGDTIFKGTFGNYRFPTGDYGMLMNSIRTKVLTLPDDTVLYSGHTPPTTVAEEKDYYTAKPLPLY